MNLRQRTNTFEGDVEQILVVIERFCDGQVFETVVPDLAASRGLDDGIDLFDCPASSDRALTAEHGQASTRDDSAVSLETFLARDSPPPVLGARGQNLEHGQRLARCLRVAVRQDQGGRKASCGAVGLNTGSS